MLLLLLGATIGVGATVGVELVAVPLVAIIPVSNQNVIIVDVVVVGGGGGLVVLHNAQYPGDGTRLSHSWPSAAQQSREFKIYLAKMFLVKIFPCQSVFLSKTCLVKIFPFQNLPL